MTRYSNSPRTPYRGPKPGAGSYKIEILLLTYFKAFIDTPASAAQANGFCFLGDRGSMSLGCLIPLRTSLQVFCRGGSWALLLFHVFLWAPFGAAASVINIFVPSREVPNISSMDLHYRNNDYSFAGTVPFVCSGVEYGFMSRSTSGRGVICWRNWMICSMLREPAARSW